MIKGYAVTEPKGRLQPFEYDPGPLGDNQVERCPGKIAAWQTEVPDCLKTLMRRLDRHQLCDFGRLVHNT